MICILGMCTWCVVWSPGVYTWYMMYVPGVWSMYLLYDGMMCVDGVCYVCGYTWCMICVFDVRYMHLVCGVYGRFGERQIACVHLVYDVCCVC